MTRRVALSLVLASCLMITGTLADDQVLTIYFMGTNMHRDMWSAEMSKFDHPETVATLWYFDTAFDVSSIGTPPAGTTRFKSSVYGPGGLNPIWDVRNDLALSHLNEVADFADCGTACITLNLVGFSRGGVSTLYFAKHVVSSPWPRWERLKKVNVLAFDPVPGDEGGFNPIDRTNFNLEPGIEYLGFYAVDERSERFSPVFPALPPNDPSNPRINFFEVRGAHETLVGNTWVNGKNDNDGDSPGGLGPVSRALRMVATEMLGSSDWGHVRFRVPSPWEEAPPFSALNLDWYGGETDIDQLRQDFFNALELIGAYGNWGYRQMREHSSVAFLEAWWWQIIGGFECNSAIPPFTNDVKNSPRCAYYYPNGYGSGGLGEADGSIDDVQDALPLNHETDGDVINGHVIWNLIAEHGSLDVDGDLVDYADDNCPETANADQTDLDGDGVGGACDCDDQDPTVVCTDCADVDWDGTSDCADLCIDVDGDGYGATRGVQPAPPLALAHVPEAADYKILYTLQIPVNEDFSGLPSVPYLIDNTALIPPTFDRVAYMLELADGAQTQWVWVSMDAFTSILPSLGVPHEATNDVVWQQQVTNLNVYASAGAPVTTGTGIPNGNIEIWHHTYARDEGLGGIGGSVTAYDWDDTWVDPSGHGSFQVHNWGEGETVFAFNAFENPSRDMSVGIGNQPQGEPDWTFAQNASAFAMRRLHVLVKPVGICLQDCNDLNADCTDDCTDVDADGYCLPQDCDDSKPNCTTDCTDTDLDGWCVTHDCDDWHPNCFDSCSDLDGDSYCVPLDCDDGLSPVYPGAVQLCDGLNNDCNDPLWPALDGSDWTTRTIFTTDPRSVFPADMNGDGDVDVLAADQDIVWYESDGSSTPSWTKHVISYSWGTAVFAADVDGDGDIDALSAFGHDDPITWFENTAGDGSDWAPHPITAATGSAYLVFAAGDFDGDGDVDALSASGAPGTTISWFENTTGDGVAWTEHPISTNAGETRSVLAADVDGDGYLDALAALAPADNEIVWYQNDGSSPPTWTARTISTAATDPTSVFAADVDGDGDMDALSSSQGDHRIVWYENDGLRPPQNWSMHTISTNAIFASSVFAADVDSDGDVDALSASPWVGTPISWHENEGSTPPAWTGRTIWVADVDQNARSVFAADIDGDGDLDTLSEDAWFEHHLGTNESDNDGDGLSECDGDCDDNNAGASLPGMEEVNDGIDNQCPGEAGYGLIDEVTGTCGYHDPAETDQLSWSAQSGATSYEVARSSSPDFSTDCTVLQVTDTYWDDTEPPLAGACFYYLVRSLTPHAGSWGRNSAGDERVNICP